MTLRAMPPPKAAGFQAFGPKTERGVRGNLSGRVNRSAILAHIAGNGFAARMVVRAQGDKEIVTMQSFTLRPRIGADIARVSVTLHK